MTLRELRDHLRIVVEEYFASAQVAYGEVNMVKPKAALVTLKTGSVSRPLQPFTQVINGVSQGCYPSRTVLEVNLFTQGGEIDVPDGYNEAYENTAVNDLIEFVNFINSPYVIDKCDTLDISITPKGSILDVTALLNNTQWEYRAMVEFDIDFMQLAVGYSGILDKPDSAWEGPTPSGGGSAKLAAKEAGYFETVEIEPEKEENLHEQP